MTSTFKATVEVGDKKVTIEGPQEFVEKQLARLATPGATLDATPPLEIGTQNSGAVGSANTEKQLVALKRPRNHAETVAVLGYYLTTNGQPEFSDEDIRKAYLRAGVRPPKVVQQALRDAKNNCEYIAVGSKRGLYKLTPHGERTVLFDMPSGNSKRGEN